VRHLAAGAVAGEDLLHEQGDGGGGVQLAPPPVVAVLAADPFDE
jgi:hypothetical protein